MDKQLKGLFGGGEAEVAEEQDFVQRYTTGNPREGYTKQEAEKYLKFSLKQASPEQIQRAFAASINNLPASDRAQFNEMLQQRQQGKGMVDIDRSGNRSDAEAGSSGEAARLVSMISSVGSWVAPPAVRGGAQD